MSFAWGLAVFLLVQAALYAAAGRTLPADVAPPHAPAARRLRRRRALLHARLPPDQRLLRAADRLRALHPASTAASIRRCSGGATSSPAASLPLVLIFHPRFASTRVAGRRVAAASSARFALLYVFIIGGQAWPLEIFPGYAVDEHASATAQIATYAPRLPGAAARPAAAWRIAFLITADRRARAAVHAGGRAGAARAAAGGGRLMAGADEPRRGCSSPPRTSRRARRRSASACAPRCARAALTVQPFKKGPDYIDPMWLTAGQRPRLPQPRSVPVGQRRDPRARSCATRRRPTSRSSRATRASTTASRSTAATATPRWRRRSALPVVLVIDARGMTRGIAPLILGYQAFDRDVRIAGVILNHLGGSRHEAKLRAVIEHYTDVPVLGAVHCDPRLAIVERHLGLMPSNEADGAAERVAAIGRDRRRAGRSRRGARGRGRTRRRSRLPPTPRPTPLRPRVKRDVRIGIAQDRAFGFYYADDLDALRAAGADAGPLRHADATPRCPTSTALFIGGGFPEIVQRRAGGQRARCARRSARAIEAGLPVYAECGGLMYLARTLTPRRAARYAMVGAIPGDVVMHERPVGRGYVNLEETADFPWPGAPAGAHGGRARTSSTTRASRTCPPTCAAPTRCDAATASTARATASSSATCSRRTRTCAAPAESLGGALRRFRPRTPGIAVPAQAAVRRAPPARGRAAMAL